MPENIAVKVSRSVSGDGTRPISGSFVEYGDMVADFDKFIPGGNAEQTVVASFGVLDVKYIFIVADQNMTVETNDPTYPGDVIQLTANRPLEWSRADGYYPCPFTVDVEKFRAYGPTSCRLKVKILR